MGVCVLCGIAAGDSPVSVVAERELAMALMDINPATDGHVLVIPRRHASDIWELGREDGVAVWQLTQDVADAMMASLRPDGLTLLQANREAAFQDVFHFHIHVIPRWLGDGVQIAWRSDPGDPPRISDIAMRIRSAL